MEVKSECVVKPAFSEVPVSSVELLPPDVDDPLDLGDLVRELTRELQDQKDKGIRDIQKGTEIMTAYDASLLEWRRFEFWDPYRYTRNLIASDGRSFTLMLLCWGPGQKSPIHDHAGSECWLRVISGSAVEELYESETCEDGTEKPLKLMAKNVHHAGAVCFINDSVGFHRIANASETEPLVTMHCYSPPFAECKAFLSGTTKGLTCKVTFFSENGELTRH